MKNLQETLIEITRLTTRIETNYPELYLYLDETPMTIPANNHPDIGINAMKDYLETLKQLLKHHIETYKNKA
ncbi:hypothetical protein [Lacinutrix sp. Hel_I_90]|uniref:hypothetical protein n=1 Tax=Lacinutrix sp. Hel_I_90 TaxID=1249999 RepID=UPI0005CB3328|nr:hypothetical protein [Lacinutrix sp. Hel_I_90]